MPRLGESAFRLAASTLARLDRLPLWLPELLFRVALALAFWRSARTKLASWDMTLALFADEYRVPLLPPGLAACLATGVEIAAPAALLLGFGTRIAALALLIMTLVIQLFVYPQSYAAHLLWAGPLLYLILRGPGLLSADHLIRRRCRPAPPAAQG